MDDWSIGLAHRLVKMEDYPKRKRPTRSWGVHLRRDGYATEGAVPRQMRWTVSSSGVRSKAAMSQNSTPS